MVLELDEFKKPTLTSLVQSAPQENSFRLAEVFPDAQSFDNKYAFDVIKQQAKLASKITGFNSSAPIRKRGDLEQVSGKVTKIMDSYYIDEDDDLKIHAAREGTNERQATIDRLLVDVVELSRGIDYILEYLRARLVYDGAFEYADPRTKVKLEFELNRPEGNDITVPTPWDAPDSDPLGDLQAAVEQYRAENNDTDPTRFDISQKVESALLRNEQIKTEVYGNDHGGRIVRKAQLQELLTELGLPQYFVNKDVTSFETINSETREVELVTRKHLADEKCVLYGDNLGSTVRGITKENNYQHGKFVEPVNEQNPPAETVIVGEAVIPAIKAINSNVIITAL